jgi:imidazolonepropionase-like amidohydrolase
LQSFCLSPDRDAIFGAGDIMTARVALLGLALGVASAIWPAVTQSPSPSATIATITIRAARVLDGRGKALQGAVVEVRGAKIVAVDTRKGPVTYDLGDVTLMPGLIDVHTHIDWHFGPDGKYPARNETPEQRGAAIAENLKATLLAGVTTIQNVGNRSDKALRDSVAAGGLVGPRILTSLGSLSSGEPDQLRERVRQLKADGADLIKIFASESIRTGGTPTMTQEQLDAVCGEARAQGLRTLVHAHADEAVLRATRAGCTQIEHGTFVSDATLKLMKDRGTYFDPNVGLVTQNYLENKARFLSTSGSYTEEGFAFMEKSGPEKMASLRRAIASGVKMPMGTDAVAGAHGQNARETIARVREGGQPPMDAIIGATSLAAESMRLGQSIGTLALGFEADIIAAAGDPLKDINALMKVVFVMKGGTVHKR